MCTSFEGIDGASRLEHDPPAAANSAVGIGLPETKADTTALERFFCVHRMAIPLWAGRVGTRKSGRSPLYR